MEIRKYYKYLFIFPVIFIMAAAILIGARSDSSEPVNFLGAISRNKPQASPSSEDFLGLTDTPDTYTGDEGSCVVVNAGGTALEFNACAAGSMTALPEGNLYVGNASNQAEATSTMFLASNGYLGIGTILPAYKLDVSGNIRLTGNLTSANINNSGIATTTMLTVSGDTYLSTIKSGTWNGTSIADAYVDNNITVDWTGLQNYPGACGVGSFVTTIGDTLTCTSATSTGYLVSGGTLTTNYHCRYDGTGIDCDRLEDASGACAANSVCMGGHTHVGVNEVYGSGWNGDTDTPEKDDVYDYAHLFDTDDDGLINSMDTDGVDAITEIAAALKDGSGDCASGLICLGDHTHSTYAPLASPTFTGTIDAGGATSFEIPNGTAPTVDTMGEIALDTTDNQLLVADSGGAVFVAGTKVQKIWSATIASTSVDFINAGLLPVPAQLDGYTITAIRCYVLGGTSKIIAVEDASANSSEDITCGTTLTSDDGSITNATYTAGELSSIDFGATSGAVNYVSISVFGTWTIE